MLTTEPESSQVIVTANAGDCDGVAAAVTVVRFILETWSSLTALHMYFTGLAKAAATA